MTERAAPLHCPYCGEESIRPWGDEPDKHHAPSGTRASGPAWRCDDCLRVFELRYKGTTGRD